MSAFSEIPATDDSGSSWSDRYGGKHRWCRFVVFPAGITPPQKVRVYERAATSSSTGGTRVRRRTGPSGSPATSSWP